MDSVPTWIYIQEEWVLCSAQRNTFKHCLGKGKADSVVKSNSGLVARRLCKVEKGNSGKFHPLSTAF